MTDIQEQSATTNENGFVQGAQSASGRIAVARKDFDAETGTLEVSFADGETRNVKLTDLPQGILTQLAGHGLSQKLGDSYASVKGDVGAAKTKFDATLAELLAGNWSKARGEGEARVTELADAIARFKGCTPQAAMVAIGKATDDQVKSWKNAPKIKALIATIKAEKAQARAEKATAESAADDAAVDSIEV
jgi:hypothetical protein